MDDFIWEMFSYMFMKRVFVIITVLSASVAPVGTFLVLRRLYLAGEAMAHAITPGVVIGFVMAGLSVTSLLFSGLIAGVGIAVLTAYLARNTILRSDDSLASLDLISLAVGIFYPLCGGLGCSAIKFSFWLNPRR